MILFADSKGPGQTAQAGLGFCSPHMAEDTLSHGAGSALVMAVLHDNGLFWVSLDLVLRMKYRCHIFSMHYILKVIICKYNAFCVMHLI